MCFFIKILNSIKLFCFCLESDILNLISAVYRYMLQQETADDYVLATGETHTIREFCELTFIELGIELEWQGEGENEKGIVRSINQSKLDALLKSSNLACSVGSTVIAVNPRYYRPAEVELLIGNPGKAKEKLGWEAMTKIKDLVKIMIKSDFEKINTNNLQ